MACRPMSKPITPLRGLTPTLFSCDCADIVDAAVRHPIDTSQYAVQHRHPQTTFLPGRASGGEAGLSGRTSRGRRARVAATRRTRGGRRVGRRGGFGGRRGLGWLARPRRRRRRLRGGLDGVRRPGCWARDRRRRRCRGCRAAGVGGRRGLRGWGLTAAGEVDEGTRGPVVPGPVVPGPTTGPFTGDTVPGADVDSTRSPTTPPGTGAGPPAMKVIRATTDRAPPATANDSNRLAAATVRFRAPCRAAWPAMSSTVVRPRALQARVWPLLGSWSERVDNRTGCRVPATSTA